MVRPDTGSAGESPAAPHALISPRTHPAALPAPPSADAGTVPGTDAEGLEATHSPPPRRAPKPRGSSGEAEDATTEGALPLRGPRPLRQLPGPLRTPSSSPPSLGGGGGRGPTRVGGPVGGGSPGGGAYRPSFPAPSQPPPLIGRLESAGGERPIRAKYTPLGAVPAVPIGGSRGN